MNSQTSSPHKKSRLWKIVLVTSLALNIAIIGAIGGAFLRFGKDGHLCQSVKTPRQWRLLWRYSVREM